MKIVTTSPGLPYILFLNIIILLECTQSADNLFHSFMCCKCAVYCTVARESNVKCITDNIPYVGIITFSLYGGGSAVMEQLNGVYLYTWSCPITTVNSSGNMALPVTHETHNYYVIVICYISRSDPLAYALTRTAQIIQWRSSY